MEPPSSHRVTILNESGAAIRTGVLEKAVCAALRRHGAPFAPVCVLLTTDEHVRDLNRRFRTYDEATDVLTFPSDEGFGAGDIAIAAPYAARQATIRGVSTDDEIGYLAIHGALHLVGFDDVTERDRAAMVEEMNAIAVEVGLPADPEWASLLHVQAS